MLTTRFSGTRTRQRTSQLPVITGCIGGILLLLFSACAGDAPATSTSSRQPAETKSPIVPSTNLLQPHTLTVGSYMNYPPQEYIDGPTQKEVGFDIDLISTIAEHMQLSVKIVPEDFQSLIDSLTQQHFDVVISAVGITPQLQNKVSFVPYFRGGESLLVLKGNPESIGSMQDLCGQIVGVKANTFEQNDLQETSDTCKKNGKQPVTITVLQNVTDAVQMLTAKHVAITYQDAPITDYMIKQNPTTVEKAGPVFDANLEGIVVRKEDPVLLQAISDVFNAAKKDGTYHKLISKWGLISGDITVLQTYRTYSEVQRVVVLQEEEQAQRKRSRSLVTIL